MLVKSLKSLLFSITLLVIIQSMPGVVFAADKSTTKANQAAKADEEGMEFTAQPGKKTGEFGAGETVVYDVDIKSSYNSAQSGTLSYLITNYADKEVTKSSSEISIGAHGEKKVTLRMPGQRSGVYKVNIMINVTEYDDTVRRTFVVDPRNIKSEAPRPDDFDQFWTGTLDSLAKVPMDAKVTLQPQLEKDGLSCYLVELRSLGKIVVRGWLTRPKKMKPEQKIPVWLALPGYGGIGVKPIYGNEDLAVFAFNPRGQGNSKDVINPSREGYLITNVERKDRYIMRGVIMDCVRALDFIFSRPELDQKQVVCSGGSMGGYLALVIASLDNRIKIVSANNPVFSDYRSMLGSKDWPMKNIEDYSRNRSIPMKTILNVLDYYDLKNFVGNIKCKSLIGISLLDNLAPPHNSYAMLNNLRNKNILKVYPNLAHEVPPSMFAYLSNWMMDEFGLF